MALYDVSRSVVDKMAAISVAVSIMLLWMIEQPLPLKK